MDAATRGPESLVRLADVVPRVIALLAAAERAMRRVDLLLTHLEDSERDICRVVARVAESDRAAREVIEAVAATEKRVEGLLPADEATLHRLSETIDYAGTRFGPRQVDELVASLDSVAPDLTELLAVSRALNELMGSLPGLGRTKKRVDEELAREQEQKD